MPATERTVADLALTGTTTGAHPMAYLRVALSEQSVLRAADVPYVPDGTRVKAAGIVTHRQRPHTAVGTDLEDESGLLNIICAPGMWRCFRAIGRRANALVVRGIVESADVVTAIRAD
ncbi:hypothetical protein [Actinomyces trachealis]|uniref:hypothetical protein n=1 Tax=Actinomyces trachealis TaxID=2763540 RepID=UPI0018929151|nr:hypothetical protein [Actinomyces trachealis]